MADGATLPPWLDLNPLAGVPMYLQGYGQGASVGESQRRSEERAYEQDLQAAAQQERNEILREARQIQAQEFAENLKLKQEQAQRAAKMAAIRLEGQQGLERDLQSGMTFQEAFPRHAPKLLFEEPASMAQLMRTLAPQANQYGEPTILNRSGQEFWHVPGSASIVPIRNNQVPEGGVEAVPITNPDTGEVTYGRPGPQGTVIPLPRGESKAVTLRKLRKEKLDWQKAKEDADEVTAKSIDAELANIQAEIDSLSSSSQPARKRLRYDESTGQLIEVK